MADLSNGVPAPDGTDAWYATFGGENALDRDREFGLVNKLNEAYTAAQRFVLGEHADELSDAYQTEAKRVMCEYALFIKTKIDVALATLGFGSLTEFVGRYSGLPGAGGTVEIGGQIMTQAQFDAAQFPLLDKTAARAVDNRAT